MSKHTAFVTIALVATLAACGPAKSAPTPTSGGTTASSATPATDGDGGAATNAPPPGAGEAEKLLVLASSCWFGGLWADAEGATDTKKAATEARCKELVGKVWGTPDDKTHYEQIRAFESSAADAFISKVGSVADSDAKDTHRKEALVKMAGAVIDAQREAMAARRAADKVKRDLDKEPDKLTADEVAASTALKKTKALDELLKLDVGDLSSDAHAIGMITAMERVNVSRGLPKHIKVFALQGVFATLFGVAAPEMPDDATKPLKKGTYLAYVTDAAKAAGHPVPDTAKTQKEKESAAWAGMLEGFAERMKSDSAKMSHDTPLYEVTERITHRLEAWYNAERGALGTKPAGSSAPASSGAPKTAPTKK